MLASRHNEADLHRARIVAQCFLFIDLQDQLHGLGKIAQAFLLSLAPTIRAGHFQVSGPEGTFVRFSTMQDAREISPGGNLVRSGVGDRSTEALQPVPFRADWFPSPRVDQTDFFQCAAHAPTVTGHAGNHDVIQVVLAIIS